MNIRTTIVLVIITVVLAGFYFGIQQDMFGFGFTKPSNTGPIVGNQQSPVFTTGLPPESVTKLELIASDGQSLTFEKTGEDNYEWWQTAPVKFPLRDDSVTGLTSTLLDLRYRRRLTTSEVSLDQAGLSTPSMTVRFTGTQPGGAVTKTLYIGGNAGVGSGYVSTDQSDDIYVVDSAVQRQLVDRGLTNRLYAMRHRGLLDTPPNRIRRMTQRYDGQDVELQQEENGEWRIIKPLPGRGNPWAMTELFRTLNSARIEAFINDDPEDLAAYGLNQPTVRLELTIDHYAPVEVGSTAAPTPIKRQYTIEIGSKLSSQARQEYYARTSLSPVVFTLSQPIVESLMLRETDLRDPRLTPRDYRNVREVRITRPADEPTKFRRKGEQWIAGPTMTYPIASDAADKLIQTIFGTGTRQFAVNPAFRDDPIKITLTIEHHAEPEELQIGRINDEDDYAVLRNDETIARIVTKDQIAALLRPALAYRSPQIISVAADDLDTIKLTRTKVYPSEYQLKRNADNSWQLDSGKMNADAVADLIDRLTPLRADGWLKDESFDPLTAPGRLEIVRRQGETIVIGFDTDHEIAQRLGDDLPFRLSQDMIRALLTEYRDTRILQLDLNRMASVTIAGIEIQRDEIGRYARPDGRPIAARRAATTFNAIAELRAEHFISPDRVPQREPDYTLLIRTTDRQVFNLRLWIPNNWDQGPAIAQINEDQPFTLIRDVIARLVAVVRSPDETMDR